MKKIYLLITVFSFLLSAKAQPPDGNAEKGMTFGIITTEKDAVDARDLNSIITSKEPKEIKIKGKVTEVCKAEGCWLRMETANGSMMIRMKDHKFFVPVSMQGKTIVANGTATIKETSVDMLRHYAEDAGKTKEEIAAIKDPKKEIVLQATGILVL
jgi:hypothetical protein